MHASLHLSSPSFPLAHTPSPHATPTAEEALSGRPARDRKARKSGSRFGLNWSKSLVKPPVVEGQPVPEELVCPRLQAALEDGRSQFGRKELVSFGLKK